MAPSIVLQQALTDSLTSGIFIDTKFFVFSRRLETSGRVGAPKSLYANSHVLKQIPHFQAMLSEEYIEGTTTDLRSDFPDRELSYRDDYEYWSDSDLEDDGLEGGDLEDEATLVDIEVKTCDQAGEGDVASSKLSLPLGKCPETCETDTQEKHLDAPVHLGKLVVIKDTAYVTFQALLYYLYTGEINFAPFTIESNRKSRGLEKASQDDNKLPRASAKSTYRIADKYDIPELKKLAFNHICANLRQSDIVTETFSRFTSLYPEIREKEIRCLASVLLSPNTETERELLMTKIQSYGEGQLSHCSDVLYALYLLVSDKNGAGLTLDVTTLKTPSDKECLITLKNALARSLKTGTFLDFKFYASKNTSASYPRQSIYCSQKAIETRLNDPTVCDVPTTLRSLAIYLNDYDPDSDLDDDETQHNVGDSREPGSKLTNYIRENPSTYNRLEGPIIFHVGAAATWKALLFHLYVGDSRVACASLRSQSPRLGGHGTTTADETLHQFDHKPKPCSPKSLYNLANKIGLSTLKDLAIKAIESKISAENVVMELFSRSSSLHRGILNMESKALVKNFVTPVTNELVLDNIKTMSQGQVRYKTEALKSIFLQSILLNAQPPRPFGMGFISGSWSEVPVALAEENMPCPTAPANPSPYLWGQSSPAPTTGNSRKKKKNGHY